MLLKKESLKIFTAILVSIFLCLPVFASVCTYDVDGNGTIDPASEYWTCIGEAGQLCPYNIADCTEAVITMSGSASIGATNIADKNGFTQIRAGAAATKLDFYGWQCADNSCTSIYTGTIEFVGTGIEGTVSVQRITRLAGNNDKIEVYGCSGDGCTEESLQGSITISGSIITGTVQSSEGFLAVEASSSDLIFTGIECSYGHCKEIPAGALTIKGSTFSICPHGSQYACYYNSNFDKYQCSTLNCSDETLGGLIGAGSKICAKDINGDGTVDFSPGTEEVKECAAVEGKGYCPIEAVPCEAETQSPVCGTGGSLNPDTDLCEAASDTSCPDGYTFNSSTSKCERDPACPSGTSYNTSMNRCEISIQWYCSVNGGTYSSQSTCNSACVQTGTCTQNTSQGAEHWCWMWNGCSGCNCSCVGSITYSANCNLTEYGDTSVRCYGGDCMGYLSCPGNWDGFTWLRPESYPGSPQCPGNTQPAGSTYRGCWQQKTGGEGGGCDAFFAKFYSWYDQIVTYTCPVTGSSYSALSTCQSNCSQGASCTGTCPDGYTVSGGVCVIDPTCPDGGILNAGIDKCEYSNICPAGYVYNAVLDVCWQVPSCPDGYTYDSNKNTCVGGYTSCPYGTQFACLPEPGTGITKCSPNECFEPLAAVEDTDEEADTTSYQNDGSVNEETGECEGVVYIFNGKGGTCKPSGMQTMFFNCCDTSEGSFLMVKKACGEEAAMTVQAVRAGRCHYVGEYCAKKWKFIGCVQRARTYCCFNSKLGRIIQEQGREQLQNFQPGGNWGSAESPNCVGFTPEQFAMIDFSRVDLSEFVGDIQGQIKTNIEEGVENKISDFYSNY